MRILIAEDRLRMAALLSKAIRREGYQTVLTHDGEAALEAVSTHHFHAIVLDVMLPKLNGFEVLSRMRQNQVKVPTILLTARDTSQDVVHGLDLGADDYLTKPFDMAVLLARLRALTRRSPVLQDCRLEVDGLLLRRDTHALECDGKAVALTRTELALMETLMRRAGRVVTKEELMRVGWNGGADVSDDTLYVFMRALRTKMQLARQPLLLHTVRGVGYMLRSVPA